MTDGANWQLGHWLTERLGAVSLATLARHFGFDAVESEGVIRFVMCDRAPFARIGHDDLVAGNTDGEAFELTRAQETELPQALKWQGPRR